MHLTCRKHVINITQYVLNLCQSHVSNTTWQNINDKFSVIIQYNTCFVLVKMQKDTYRTNLNCYYIFHFVL